MHNVNVGMNKEALRAFRQSPGMVRITREKAREVARAAKADAPVGTGRYRDSIQMDSGIITRAVARVFSDAPYAVMIEFGTVDTPKFRTLGRALDVIADE